jgi:hypothetical protein
MEYDREKMQSEMTIRAGAVTMQKIFILLLMFLVGYSQQEDNAFDAFITREGDKLMEGNKEFRFLSFNIPNLHFIEDNMPFEETNPYRLPDSFEIADALLSVQQMGGQVVRIYTITVFKEEAPEGFPCHVLGPGQFNEEAFVALDRILALANQIGIRLIIPLVDNWKWMGGVPQYAAFRNKQPREFWTDSLLIADFKKTIAFVLTRKNTFTGITYSEDRAILAWETGNELYSPFSWTAEIATYIKSLDANHLVLDGTGGALLREEMINQPDIDLLQTHHYEKDAHRLHADRGGELIYYVPQPIHACTLYMFSAKDTVHLQCFLSQNGVDFIETKPAYAHFSTGKGEYQYLFPIWYRFETNKENNYYIKIRFIAPCALSRVEIEYSGI